MTALINRLERLNEWVGYAVAWLTVAMVIVTTTIVIERYWFSTGSIRLQESVTYMHAAVLMLAAAYTLTTGGHVRVDIIYSTLSQRGKAWVDLLGTCFLLMPICFLLIWYSWDYVAVSWQISESSQEANGLPFPFPALMKSFIPAAASLLLLQGVVIVSRSVAQLKNIPAEQ